MAIRYINVGSTPNDNSGSTLRVGGQLLNNNFSIMLNALSTDGSTLTINTAATPSNTYLSATYPSNTYLIATYASNTALHSTFAQNTATISLINDRLQVANAAATYGTLTQVNDRVQVANASPFVATAFSNSVPNYGAAVTYNVQANGQTGFVITNMGFDKIGNNPTLTVRNESTVAFALNLANSDLSSAALPLSIKSGLANANFSNTLIHVGTNGTVSTGASAQNKSSGVLYWQIPHDISGSGNNYQLYSSANTNFEANVVIKDTGAI